MWLLVGSCSIVCVICDIVNIFRECPICLSSRKGYKKTKRSAQKTFHGRDDMRGRRPFGRRHGGPFGRRHRRPFGRRHGIRQIDDQPDPGHMTIPLTMANDRSSATVQGILGGRRAAQRLHELGILPGATVLIVRSGISGPVLVEVNGCRLALGNGMARRVMITV